MMTNKMQMMMCAAATMMAVSVSAQAETSSSNVAPTRVICLAPSYTETMVALQLQDHIAGVTTSSDHVEAVKDVERVGLFMRPNLEKILSLRPDLVFAANFSGQSALVDKLRELNINVVIMEMNRIEDILAMVKRMGEIFNQPERAEKLNEQMEQLLRDVEKRTAGLKRPRIYVEAGSDPLFTCGKGSFIDELLRAVGGENIAGDMDSPYPRISSELIISRDPEIIILPYMAGTAIRKTVRARSGWQVISAIKTNLIYDDLGAQMITIPSPRLILQGLPELLKRIHPELSEVVTESRSTDKDALIEKKTETE